MHCVTTEPSSQAATQNQIVTVRKAYKRVFGGSFKSRKVCYAARCNDGAKPKVFPINRARQF